MAVADTGRSGGENVILMDMGQHAIKEWPEPQLLYQVLVPGLEDRARLAPEINTFEQITTGAPADPMLGHALFVTYGQSVMSSPAYVKQHPNSTSTKSKLLCG